MGKDVLETSGGQNVTCLVKFTVHSGGFTSPGKPSEISCFPFAVSEQTTGGRMESRLVGVTLVFLISNIAMSSLKFLRISVDFLYFLLLKVFAQSSQSVTIHVLSLFS